jgi:hypothetical protein
MEKNWERSAKVFGHRQAIDDRLVYLASVGHVNGLGFGDRPIKWSIAKKTHQNMHPQLININLEKSIIIKGV